MNATIVSNSMGKSTAVIRQRPRQIVHRTQGRSWLGVGAQVV